MSEPVFTVSQAATACAVARSTIYRNMQQLTQHGATRAGRGWKIPVSALVASGLMPRTTPPDATNESVAKHEAQQSLQRSTQQPDETVQQLEVELQQAMEHIAQLEADKRVAEVEIRMSKELIEAQRIALRAIEATPQQQAISPPALAVAVEAGTRPSGQDLTGPASSTAKPKRRWFWRK